MGAGGMKRTLHISLSLFLGVAATASAAWLCARPNRFSHYDMLFWAAIWAIFLGFFVGPATLRQEWRMRRRMRRGYCPNCGYNLRKDFDTGCPECGWNREP